MSIGAPTLLGSANATSGVAATLAMTTTADSPVGSLVIVAVAYRSASAISSVTDSAGNTYSGDTQTTNTVSVRLFWSVITTDLPSGGTITATYASSTSAKIITAIVIAGCATSSPADAMVSATGTSTGPSVTSGTLTLTNGSEIAIGVVVANGTETWSPEGTGFTGIGSVPQSTVMALHWAYQTVSSNTALTYAPTMSASVAWAAQIQGFYAAASGSTVTGAGTASAAATAAGVGAALASAAGTASTSALASGLGAAIAAAAGSAGGLAVVSGAASALASTAGSAGGVATAAGAGASTAAGSGVGTANGLAIAAGVGAARASAAGAAAAVSTAAGAGASFAASAGAAIAGSTALGVSGAASGVALVPQPVIPVGLNTRLAAIAAGGRLVALAGAPRTGDPTK